MTSRPSDDVRSDEGPWSGLLRGSAQRLIWQECDGRHAFGFHRHDRAARDAIGCIGQRQVRPMAMIANVRSPDLQDRGTGIVLQKTVGSSTEAGDIPPRRRLAPKPLVGGFLPADRNSANDCVRSGNDHPSATDGIREPQSLAPNGIAVLNVSTASKHRQNWRAASHGETRTRSLRKIENLSPKRSWDRAPMGSWPSISTRPSVGSNNPGHQPEQRGLSRTIVARDGDSSRQAAPRGSHRERSYCPSMYRCRPIELNARSHEWMELRD